MCGRRCPLDHKTNRGMAGNGESSRPKNSISLGHCLLYRMLTRSTLENLLQDRPRVCSSGPPRRNIVNQPEKTVGFWTQRSTRSRAGVQRCPLNKTYRSG
jgi:hypothetical protein